MPETLFLAVERVSATPYSPWPKPTARTRPTPSGCRHRCLLLVENLVKSLVDERQRLAHAQSFALGVEYAGVTSINRHAGADGRLSQVHWSDVAVLEVDECVG